MCPCTQTDDIWCKVCGDQSVPKYFWPKWLGATGWISDVKIFMCGNHFIIAVTPTIQTIPAQFQTY